MTCTEQDVTKFMGDSYGIVRIAPAVSIQLGVAEVRNGISVPLAPSSSAHLEEEWLETSISEP